MAAATGPPTGPVSSSTPGGGGAAAPTLRPGQIIVDQAYIMRQEAKFAEMAESMEALRLIVAKQGSQLRQQEVQVNTLMRKIEMLEAGDGGGGAGGK